LPQTIGVNKSYRGKTQDIFLWKIYVCGKQTFLIMPLSKEQKNKTIDKLIESLQKQKAMVFVNYSGLNAQEIFELRNKLKQAGAKLTISKKTLARIAFEKQGIDFPDEMAQGELAIIFGEQDEAAPAKIVYNFSKEQEALQISGGSIGGGKDCEFLDKNKIIALAEIPCQKELFARLVGVLSAPIRNFVYLQQANIKGLVYVLAKAKI
jgi:large subunit ribosomal protein L10